VRHVVKFEGDVRDLSPELAKKGLALVTVIQFPLGVGSLAADMRKARDAGAEALVVYAVGQEQAVAAQSGAAAQTYDAMQLMLFAAFQIRGEINIAYLKRAMENGERPYQGVVTTHTNPFSAKGHDAFTENMAERSGRVLLR